MLESKPRVVITFKTIKDREIQLYSCDIAYMEGCSRDSTYIYKA